MLVKSDGFQKWTGVNHPGDGHYDPTLDARNAACNAFTAANADAIAQSGQSDTEYGNAHNADCKYVWDQENSQDVRSFATVGALALAGAGLGYMVTKGKK